MEAIILAGGLGTRLRGVIGEAPKCMAPVGGRPFLAYLFRHLEREGCTRCVLSLGYRHQAVCDWLMENEPSFEVTWVVENEPLGTGGGIRLALQACRKNQVVVLNGDTMFDIGLRPFFETHAASGAETTLALKTMRNFDRYGTVETDDNDRITAFREKTPMPAGDINGGVYCIDRQRFLSRSFPEKFSFEKDYLEAEIAGGILYGTHLDAYFIDIGIPEDYERAQTEVPALFSPAS